MVIKTERCGWAGSIDEFLAVDLVRWGKALVAFHQSALHEDATAAQKRAWMDCFGCLQKYLPGVIDRISQSAGWTIIFEYERTRESGRRPDVILFSGSDVFVLEFKQFDHADQAHLDQVAAYGRDLRNYHQATHLHRVFSVLVLTKASGILERHGGVWVMTPDRLGDVLSQFSGQSDGRSIDAVQWLEADYEPLPALVSAARRLFEHEPLPQIRSAQSTGISVTVNEIVDIVVAARETRSHHLVLVTGVPGSGKTLVGLQLVYEKGFDAAAEERLAIG
jgi:hypothetical protein